MKLHAFIGLSILSSIYGPCSKDDAAADAAADVAVVTVEAAAPVVEPVAKNATAVARFPSDTKLDLSKEKLQANITFARESPGGGNLVASLKKDVEVTKVASHSQNGEEFLLVAFNDPKDATSILNGWIPKSGFTASAAVPVGTAAKGLSEPCGVKGQVRFVAAACKFECSSAVACPAGFKCSGIGTRVETGDAPVQFCESAGSGTVSTNTALSCTGNLVLSTDGKCHQKCKTNKDCPNKGTCSPVPGGNLACF